MTAPGSGDLDDAERAALEVIPRLFERDHTTWAPDPTEITDRLGWLDAPHRADTGRLLEFADTVVADGVTDVLLVGMGGSSLFPRLLAELVAAGRATSSGAGVRLTVLDSTDPAAVLDVEERLPWRTTMLLVASKSGTTVETIAHLDRFRERLVDVHGEDAGQRIVAVTDRGSSLERRAGSDRFRHVFHGDPDVGGRYSALTAFGLLPATLLGLDVDVLLAGATDELAACRSNDPAVNPAVRLGAAIATAARHRHGELVIAGPDGVPAFGAWIEQLVAESLGKDGVGVLPVLEVAGSRSGSTDEPVVTDGGRRVVTTVDGDGLAALGRQVVRFEVATAVAGALLGVNPFDQPDVAAAKAATARVLDEGRDLPPLGDPGELVAGLADDEALVLLAFVTPDGRDEAAVRAAADRVRAGSGRTVTVGIGPRYLHSTGQLHKGGPDLGGFVVVVGDDPRDAEIPGRGYGFSRLKRAQAAGDLDALVAADRRVVHASVAALAEL